MLQTDDVSTLNISYRHTIAVKSQLIYTSVLAAIVITFALLPFIKVDVSIKNTGMLQPTLEKTDLLIPVNGHINFINLQENLKVKAGDTLLKIDASLNQQQHQLNITRIGQLNTMLKDIKLIYNALTKVNFINTTLNTSNAQYTAAWQQLIYQLKASAIKKAQAEKNFDRHQTLYTQKVLSTAEFETIQTAYNQSIADYDYLIKQAQTQWQAEANQYRTELSSLYQKQADWQEQERYYTLVAPVNGSLQNIKGLQKGANVYSNQKIAEISPDLGLIAVCYVSPADIGLIKKQQKVRLMIDAFNYNQWGIMDAKVMDIADDILIMPDNRPVFKVKCQLQRNYMQLSNGYKGQLKKGMTFGASFFVARRSLFQLLYDKTDDWLNPNTLKK
jgi:membrane fusion protein, peptide pheromone/bacteriocin exporter